MIVAPGHTKDYSLASTSGAPRYTPNDLLSSVWKSQYSKKLTFFYLASLMCDDPTSV